MSGQSSRLFVKVVGGAATSTPDRPLDSSNGVICDPANCRVCVRVASSTSSKTSNVSNSSGPKPKWWKAIVKNTAEEWKDLPVESVFPPETSNNSIAMECLPMLINAALEGSSTCLAVSSSDPDAADQALYCDRKGVGVGSTDASGAAGAKSLIATSVSWLFDLIDTFRVARNSARFSVRVSAVRMFINASNNTNANSGSSSSNNNNNGAGCSEITTTDLLEHIAQDGSSGDIPKLLGVGRLAGPRELRASSAKQALGYVDSALRAIANSKPRTDDAGVFVFSLNVYQYQIERQTNGSETISGGRGQFHFVDLSKASSSDSAFLSLQERVVGALSRNLPSANLPTAFASLTGQTLRELQRCRLCHFLALISPQSPQSRKVLELFDVASSSSSSPFPASFASACNLMPKSCSMSKRRQSPQLADADGLHRQTSSSFDSATLPRLASFTSSSAEASSLLSMSTSIHGRLSNCVSGSELSIHTVIHRPSPPPLPQRPANFHHQQQQPATNNKVMQTSITSELSHGAPLSLASSHFSSSMTRPSAYSDSETESVCRLRQPSLAPMQPLGFNNFNNNDMVARYSDDEQLPLDPEEIAQLNSRRSNALSVSANCSPVKQPLSQQRHNQQQNLQQQQQSAKASGRYARLKRFASSRMKRQIEQQKMWAMMAATSKVGGGAPSGGVGAPTGNNNEIWIDGPGAVNQQKLQQVEDWIDGPMSFMRGSNNNNNVHQLTVEQDRFGGHSHNHRSLPRMRRHHPTIATVQQMMQPVDLQRPLAAIRAKKAPNNGSKTGHRPPSISCSSENLFVDSGYFAESTTHSASSNQKNNLRLPPAMLAIPPQNARMDPLMESVDFLQQQQEQQRVPAAVFAAAANNGLRFKTSQPNVVSWAAVQDAHRLVPPNQNFHAMVEYQQARPISESKKVQSPFMRLKNKILGTNNKKQQTPLPPFQMNQVVLPPIAQRPATASVPSSPAVLAKRQHQTVNSSAAPTQQQQNQQNQQQQHQNRMSRLTDTSDSGNDSGVALFGPSSGVITGLKVTTGPEDALSTTKSLSSSSSQSPPSPVSTGLPASSALPGQKTVVISSGSVCSHSSGRGSSTSLLSHSAGGSQPSIAESAELLAIRNVSSASAALHPTHLNWAVNAAALASVEEELASAVSALQQTLGAPADSSSVQQTQQPRRQQPSAHKVPTMLAVQSSSSNGDRGTPRQQRRHLKLDISEVSESPSRDELLCLESLEQQLLS